MKIKKKNRNSSDTTVSDQKLGEEASALVCIWINGTNYRVGINDNPLPGSADSCSGFFLPYSASADIDVH